MKKNIFFCVWFMMAMVCDATIDITDSLHNFSTSLQRLTDSLGAQAKYPRPNLNTYWVLPDKIPGRFLAGEYPGAKDVDATRKRIQQYLDAGITYFVDLTEEREPTLNYCGDTPILLEPYDHILQEEAAVRGIKVVHKRISIKDMGTPINFEYMDAILEAIDTALAEGYNVYVHCYGGIGRTGTTVACYLVKHGMTAQQALATLASWWPQMKKSNQYPESPQTQEQKNFITGYERHLRPR